MPFAVELDMDDHAAAAVRQVWQSLVDAGIPSLPLSLGARPHLSLCVYESLDLALTQKQLERFTRQTKTFPFELDAVETFPGSSGVVFLAPRPSESLVDLHVRFHTDFTAHRATASRYYLPGNWKPHCTIAEELSSNQVDQAIKICRNASLPICGQFIEMGLIEFRPVKRICHFRLATQ